MLAILGHTGMLAQAIQVSPSDPVYSGITQATQIVSRLSPLTLEALKYISGHESRIPVLPRRASFVGYWSMGLPERSALIRWNQHIFLTILQGGAG